MRKAGPHTGLERITVAERERPGGRPASTGVRRDDGRPGRNAGGNRGERVPIGERVRQAHLEHFCPGGAGLPVTDSGPIGLSWVAANPAGWEANAARAAGQRCGRCGQPVTGRQDARKRASGSGSTRPAPTGQALEAVPPLPVTKVLVTTVRHCSPALIGSASA